MSAEAKTPLEPAAFLVIPLSDEAYAATEPARHRELVASVKTKED